MAETTSKVRWVGVDWKFTYRVGWSRRKEKQTNEKPTETITVSLFELSRPYFTPRVFFGLKTRFWKHMPQTPFGDLPFSWGKGDHSIFLHSRTINRYLLPWHLPGILSGMGFPTL